MNLKLRRCLGCSSPQTAAGGLVVGACLFSGIALAIAACFLRFLRS